MKTVLTILTVSFATVIGQLILKKGVAEIGVVTSFGELAFQAIKSPLVLLSLFLQGLSFFLWISVLSKANLGYAFGISGAFFYLLLPLLSWVFFDERLEPMQWLGLFMITIGVTLIILKRIA